MVRSLTRRGYTSRNARVYIPLSCDLVEINGGELNFVAQVQLILTYRAHNGRLGTDTNNEHDLVFLRHLLPLGPGPHVFRIFEFRQLASTY